MGAMIGSLLASRRAAPAPARAARGRGAQCGRGGRHLRIGRGVQAASAPIVRGHRAAMRRKPAQESAYRALAVRPKHRTHVREAGTLAPALDGVTFLSRALCSRTRARPPRARLTSSPYGRFAAMAFDGDRVHQRGRGRDRPRRGCQRLAELADGLPVVTDAPRRALDV